MEALLFGREDELLLPFKVVFGEFEEVWFFVADELEAAATVELEILLTTTAGGVWLEEFPLEVVLLGSTETGWVTKVRKVKLRESEMTLRLLSTTTLQV